MPIIKEADGLPPAPKPTDVVIAKKEHRGVTVDTRYTDRRALITHIEGSAWTVNYYHRILDKDNAIAGINVDADPAYYQYKLIQKFEMKVTTPLTQSQNQETKEFTVQGQANIFPVGMVPNPGDLFLADVGDGREAIFQLTTSEQRSIYKDAAYTCDYILVNYSDEAIDDLNSKVVENLYYVKEFMAYGQNPLLSFDEYRQLQVLRELYAEITEYYLKRFISREYATLLLPGQDFPIYDPMLTSAFLKMFRMENHYEIQKIRELNVGDLDAYEADNIWTAVMNRRRNELRGGVQQVGVLSVRYLTKDPMQESARYSGIPYIICPKDEMKSEDDAREKRGLTFSDVPIVHTPTRLTRLFELVTLNNLNGLPYTAVSVNPVSDETYIFSRAFYNNDSVGQSILELQIQNYLDGKAYNVEGVLQLAATYRSWGLLEQFYQIPFLLLIVRAIIRRM